MRLAIDYFADGSELLLMHSGDTLYLGIRSNDEGMIVGNVFLVLGDEITILHSSAALGTAVYQRQNEIWEQSQAFTWRCRASDQSERAQEEREAFLAEEGWLAANARMGTPNELEYRIDLSGETPHLAANFLQASAPDVKIPWPANLADDVIRPTPGGLPQQMRFSTEGWAKITLSPESEATAGAFETGNTPTLPNPQPGEGPRYQTVLEPFSIINSDGNSIHGLIRRPDPALYPNLSFAAVVKVPGGYQPRPHGSASTRSNRPG